MTLTILATAILCVLLIMQVEKRTHYERMSIIDLRRNKGTKEFAVLTMEFVEIERSSHTLEVLLHGTGYHLYGPETQKLLGLKSGHITSH